MSIRQVTALILLSLTVFACSKKDDPVKNDEPLNPRSFDPVTDSIIKAEHLKFTDTAGLRISPKKMYKDSTNSTYFQGKRNGKFWFGVFSEQGDKLFDKTYYDDTDTLHLDKGAVLKLDTLFVYEVKRIGDMAYIMRVQLCKEESLSPGRQVVSAYNITERRVTDYRYVFDPNRYIGQMCFLSLIPWTKGRILINLGENGRYTREAKAIAIADKELRILELIRETEYGAVEFPQSPLCIPISDYDFVKVVDRRVFRKSIKAPGEKWHIVVNPRLPDVNVTLKSYSLSGRILSITLIKAGPGGGDDFPPSTVRVDVELGLEIM